MGRTAPRLLAAGVLAASLAACGTTVPLSGGSVPADSLGGVPVATSGTGTTGSTAQLPGTVPGSTGTGGTSGASTTGAVDLPTSVPTGPGGTTTKLPPIQIGTYYLNGGNAALAAAGFGGLVIPDSKPVFDAFVNDLNKHGGLAGRQIQPVYFEYNTGQDPHTQDAAACAKFTQDNHVFLVLGGINSGAGELLPCLAQHDVPLITAASGGDEQFFAQYHRYSYELGQLNFTAGFQLLISNLKARGYLASVKKVGLVQFPGAGYDRAVVNGLIPALKGVGLKLDERVHTGSSTDNASIASDSASAVLKFQTEGIDLVVFLSPGGAPETYFMTAADKQGYTPKYGIWSPDSPTVLATTAPPNQLANSMGVGWLPGLDVATAQDPTAGTPAAKACLAKGRQLGLDESGLANPLIRATCDTLSSLLGAINGNPQATQSTLLLEKGFDALGTSIAPASTFGIFWTPGHHDGANGYRNLHYDSGCRCFSYQGSTQLIRR